MVEALKTEKTGSAGPKVPELAKWLEERCRAEGLSYRQAAKKADVSHATIAAISKGVRPSADTIIKLAKAFGTEGPQQKGVLEDYLLGLCGYRSHRVEKQLSEPLARLLDKLGTLDESRLKLVEYFVDFSATLGDGHQPWKNHSP